MRRDIMYPAWIAMLLLAHLFWQAHFWKLFLAAAIFIILDSSVICIRELIREVPQ